MKTNGSLNKEGKNNTAAQYFPKTDQPIYQNKTVKQSEHRSRNHGMVKIITQICPAIFDYHLQYYLYIHFSEHIKVQSSTGFFI